MLNLYTYNSPLGELVLGSYQDKLVLCDFADNPKLNKTLIKISAHFAQDFHKSQSPCLIKTQFQLDEYFNKQRKCFSIDTLLVGTEFQKKVWQELTRTEYGQSSSYKSLSENLGQPSAIRAIASANRANPLAIIIPCHRIIGIKGDLVGYSGGLDKKKKLLELEGAFFKDQTELFS